MSPWVDFREKIGIYNKTIYRYVVIHTLCVGAALYLGLRSNIFIVLSVIILTIILHFKVHHSVCKITKLYQEVASMILDSTYFEFYMLDQKLDQDSEKLQQLKVEKARKTMNSLKSEEFIKKYQRYHRVMRNLDTGYFIYFVAYLFGLRQLFSFLHLKSWYWELLLVLPLLLQFIYPFYFDAWVTLRNGRKLCIAMFSFTLKKVIKNLDSDNLVEE